MAQDQDNPILQEKEALIKSLSTQNDYLRLALSEIADDLTGAKEIAKEVLASYMSADGWVRQTDDGRIVLGWKP